MNTKQLRYSLALLIAATVPACVDAEDAPIETPTTTLAASDHATSDLGVTTWDVMTEGEAVRVIGRDASGARKAELVVERDAMTPDDRVHVDTVFPDHHTFDLTGTGQLDGAVSEYAQLLGAALYSDLGHRTTPATAAPGAGLGTVSSSITTRSNGQLYLGWSMFGYGGYADVGDWCRDTTRSEASTATTSYGVAWRCDLEWKSFAVTDCRARVNYAISGFHYDTCNWWVFVN